MKRVFFTTLINMKSFSLMLFLIFFNDSKLASALGIEGGVPPCANSFEVVSGVCKFVPEHHFCDHGNGLGIPPSAVGMHVEGTFANNREKFDALANKKLACCLNSYTIGDPYTKFDCIDNSRTPKTDFNELWVSGDDALTEGGQMNAIVLLNGGRKIMSGFYALNGSRCDEFSEFASETDMQGYKVNPAVVSGQQALAAGGLEAVPAYKIPVPTSSAYTAFRTSLTKRFPSTAKDYLRCPILVRAAIVANCPHNPMMPVVQKSFPITGNPARCSVASTVQVHIRIEQLYEIMGQPKLPTYDTVKDLSSTGTISTERLLAQKMGTSCEPGAEPRGPVCVYTSP